MRVEDPHLEFCDYEFKILVFSRSPNPGPADVFSTSDVFSTCSVEGETGPGPPAVVKIVVNRVPGTGRGGRLIVSSSRGRRTPQRHSPRK